MCMGRITRPAGLAQIGTRSRPPTRTSAPSGVSRGMQMAVTHTEAGPGARRFLEPAPGRARDDADLLARYQDGDPVARSEVVERFLPLARQLARRYARG